MTSFGTNTTCSMDQSTNWKDSVRSNTIYYEKCTSADQNFNVNESVYGYVLWFTAAFCRVTALLQGRKRIVFWQWQLNGCCCPTHNLSANPWICPWVVCCTIVTVNIPIIRERGSILYLRMAKEILNLPWLCITRIMAKEATNLKPSMQREW